MQIRALGILLRPDKVLGHASRNEKILESHRRKLGAGAR
jgi:hypothetical protein